RRRRKGKPEHGGRHHVTPQLHVSAPPLLSSADSSVRLGMALGRYAYIALCAFVLVIPLEESRQFGDFLVSRALGGLALAFAILYVIVSGQLRSPSLLHLWMAALVGWAALSFFWTADCDSSVVQHATY